MCLNIEKIKKVINGGDENIKENEIVIMLRKMVDVDGIE